MDEFDPKQYWEARLTKDCDAIGVGYARLGRYYNRWLYRVRKHVFRRLVKSLAVDLSSCDVLDIGSGTGFYIDRWREAGVKSMVGVDITQVVVDKLRREYPDCSFVQLDIGDEGVTIEERRFDVISCFDVLFHIVDDKKYDDAYTNVRRLLRDNGTFILSEGFLRGSTRRGRHAVFRRADTIEGILSKHGFRILRRQPMFVLMNEPHGSSNRLLAGVWNRVVRIVSRSDLVGWFLGCLLYPVEVVLLRLLSRSYSTQILVCRKVSRPEDPPR